MRSGGGRKSSGGYRDPCLTMHQPWASLLVHGIKRMEGRSWPSPLTGRLWIHAASKVPDPDTVAAMEDFYREIHAVDGVTTIDFPQHYPVSRLLGCVEVRLEGLTDFCWLCENPQKLVVPLEMRGYQGVYNLETRIYEEAVRGLSPVQGPLPVKFPLPVPRNPFSLKPGSLNFDSSKSTLVKTPSVSAAIAGARAAANQYLRKDNNAAAASSEIQTRKKPRENRADGSSGSGSLLSVVQDNTSHSPLPNPSPVVQNTPSYSRNQNPPSVIVNSPSHSQNHNHSAAATSSEIQTWTKSREDRPDSSSGSGSLPSAVQDSPSHSQRQNPLSTVQNIPSYSQNQNPVSIVGSIPIYSQSQNPPPIVHTIPSYPRNQIPVSIVGSIPVYSQGQNPPSIVQNIQPYPRNQNPPENVQNSPTCSPNQNPFDSHNQNLPSIGQNGPSFLHSHNPSPSVQSRPSHLQNHNPSLAIQNSPSVLQTQNAEPQRRPRLQSGASNRLFAVALRELKQLSSSKGRVRRVPKSRPE